MKILRSLITIAAVSVLLAGCATVAASPPKRSAITLSGDGKIDTAKFAMSGDYSVEWQTLHDCTYYVNLEPNFADVFSATAPLTGTNNIHGLAAGEYYFHVNTGPSPECGWSLTLTPVN